MIKLKSLLPESFLVNEKYANPVEDNLMSFLQNNCRVAVEFYKKEICLYRGDHALGIQTDNGAAIVDPKGAGTPRRSKDTSNAYVMYMETNPHWKAFPERSWSLICGSRSTAADFSGNRGLYIVFPIGDPEFAVSRGADFIEQMFSFNNIRCGVSAFDTIIGCLADGHFDEPPTFTQNLMNAINQIISDMSNNYAVQLPIRLEQMAYKPMATLIWDMIKNSKDIDEAMDKVYSVLTPATTGTQLKKYSQFDSADFDSECWTESKCVLVPVSIAKQLFSNEEENPDDFV